MNQSSFVSQNNQYKQWICTHIPIFSWFSWGTPLSLAYFMENPHLKWMMTGGSIIQWPFPGT